jgi:hypothetical protein
MCAPVVLHVGVVGERGGQSVLLQAHMSGPAARTQSNTLTTVVANTIVRAQPAFLNANLYTTPHTPQIS